MEIITVHGRFQPPVHKNHNYTYLENAFNLAKKVLILITNPNLNESEMEEARHRNKKENNPFTYQERVRMFTKFFQKIGIPSSRYAFKPFNITNDKE